MQTDSREVISDIPVSDSYSNQDQDYGTGGGGARFIKTNTEIFVSQQNPTLPLPLVVCLDRLANSG